MSALAYVSSTLKSTNSSVGSLATSALSLSAGNHAFVYIRWEGGDTTTSISDTAGNTYTATTSVWNTADGVGGRWFYVLNATGNGSNVTTLTLGASRSFVSVYVLQFSGSTPSSVSASTKVTSSAGTVITSDADLSVAADGLLLAGESNYNFSNTASVTDTASNTWTTFYDSGWVYSYASYGLISSGVVNDSVTYTGSGSSNRVLICLAVSPGGGGGASARPVVIIGT